MRARIIVAAAATRTTANADVPVVSPVAAPASADAVDAVVAVVEAAVVVAAAVELLVVVVPVVVVVVVVEPEEDELDSSLSESELARRLCLEYLWLQCLTQHSIRQCLRRLIFTAFHILTMRNMESEDMVSMAQAIHM